MDYHHNLSQRSWQMYALIEKYQNNPLSKKAFCQQDRYVGGAYGTAVGSAALNTTMIRFGHNFMI